MGAWLGRHRALARREGTRHRDEFFGENGDNGGAGSSEEAATAFGNCRERAGADMAVGGDHRRRDDGRRPDRHRRQPPLLLLRRHADRGLRQLVRVGHFAPPRAVADPRPEPLDGRQHRDGGSVGRVEPGGARHRAPGDDRRERARVLLSREAGAPDRRRARDVPPRPGPRRASSAQCGGRRRRATRRLHRLHGRALLGHGADGLGDPAVGVEGAPEAVAAASRGCSGRSPVPT